MDSNVLKRALDIADEALELSDDQRLPFLCKACGDDEQLRHEVECLLQHSGGITIAEQESTVEMPALPPVSDRFIVQAELSRGGMGIVYRAHDKQLDREVAVKVLRETFLTNAGVVKRFLSEAKVCGRMQHPGTPPIYDFGTLSDGIPFIAMKLVCGETLAALLKSPSGNPPSGNEKTLWQLLTIFKQICETIAYAHSLGIIHRDLKPDNVMVSQFGDVQVMDWGLAKMLGADQEEAESDPEEFDPAELLESPIDSIASEMTTRAGTLMGTPAYMAPEQVQGVTAPTIDVFQLGAILCEILTGSPPYRSDSPLDVYSMALQGELNDAMHRLDRCTADGELVQIARKCLDPDPNRRFANGSDLSIRFTGYLSSVQSRLRETELAAARAETKVAEEQKRRRVATSLAAVVVLSVVTFLGGLSWMLRQRAHQSEERAQHAEELAAIEREQAHQRKNTERAFNDALIGAVQLVERAKAAPLTDTETWNGARAAIAHAASLLTNNPDLKSLEPRYTQLNDSFHSVEVERKIALDVMGARDMTFEHPGFFPWGDTQPNIDKLDRVVADNGFHPDSHADEPIIIARMKALPRAIREQVIGAIDQYSLISDAEHRETFERILDESDTNIWRKRWRTAFRNGDAETLRQLVSDSSVDSQSARSLINLVRSAEAHVDVATQVDFLKHWYPRHNQDPWYNYLLADLLCRSHRTEEAIPYFHGLLSARPNHRTRVFLGYALVHQGHYSEAIPHLQAACRSRPTNQNYQNLLIYALLRAARYEETIATCQEARGTNAPTHFALLAMGRARMELGELDQACAQFTSGASGGQMSPGWQAKLLHAECLRRLGRHLESLEIFESIDLGDDQQWTGALTNSFSTMAGVALVVANGANIDSATIEDDRARHWRTRAREWMTNCLTVHGFDVVAWNNDSVFAAMREPEMLAAFPKSERQPWNQLWQQVDAMAGGTAGVDNANWKTVVPVTTQTRSGVRFVVQDDGSLVVAGPVRSNDVYSLTFQSHDVTAVKLELMTDPQLVNDATRRRPAESIELGEIGLDVVGSDRNSRPFPVSFSHCITDFDDEQMVERCIDGNLETAWRLDSEPDVTNSVILVLHRPLESVAGDQLQLHVLHGGIEGKGIEGFRVSVTNQPFATDLFVPDLSLSNN